MLFIKSKCFIASWSYFNTCPSSIVKYIYIKCPLLVYNILYTVQVYPALPSMMCSIPITMVSSGKYWSNSTYGIGPVLLANIGPIPFCTLGKHWSSTVFHYWTYINEKKTYKIFIYATVSLAQATQHFFIHATVGSVQVSQNLIFSDVKKCCSPALATALHQYCSLLQT